MSLTSVFSEELLVEPHLVAHRLPERRAQLWAMRHGDGPGGNPARLGVADHPGDAPAELQADLGKLGGLAEPVSPQRTTDLVLGDGLLDLLPALDDGQLGRVANGRDARLALLAAEDRGANVGGELVDGPVGRPAAR